MVMLSLCKILLLGILFVSTIAHVSSSDNNNDECSLYLAVSSSSTVDETKWGVFAGKTIEPKTLIGYPEVGIPVPYLRSNSLAFVDKDEDDDEQMQLIDEVATFFESFFWVSETIGSKFEYDSTSSESKIIAALSGLGVLASYNEKLTNAGWNTTSAYHRTLLGETTGVAHPNRGSISHFYSAHVQSSARINVGAEIFLDFGKGWHNSQEDDEDDENKIVDDDYDKLDATVNQIISFFEKHKEKLQAPGSKDEVYNFVVRDVLKAAVGQIKADKLAALLPASPDDLFKVTEAGGTRSYGSPGVVRSLDWLNENGLCIDKIRPGASTIPNAGRGAFATRTITKDTMIAPVPLVHFHDKSMLDVYELVLDEESNELHRVDKTAPIGRQLLENYVYSHKESNMFFIPVGSSVPLINHSTKPNAKLVWSKHPSHQMHWLTMNPVELVQPKYLFSGLLMEVVALRDIDADEEIFIDYGTEWQAAYDFHVKEWNAKVATGTIASKWPIRALDFNDRYSRFPYETKTELEKEYPAHVQLKAFLLIKDSTNVGSIDDPKIWDEDSKALAYHHDNLLDVTVVAREEIIQEVDVSTATTQTVGTLPYKYTIVWNGGDGNMQYVTNVPHDAIVFVDKAGTSDIFTLNPFRHSISIPDDIFPQGPWRNIK